MPFPWKLSLFSGHPAHSKTLSQHEKIKRGAIKGVGDARHIRHIPLNEIPEGALFVANYAFRTVGKKFLVRFEKGALQKKFELRSEGGKLSWVGASGILKWSNKDAYLSLRPAALDLPSAGEVKKAVQQRKRPPLRLPVEDRIEKVERMIAYAELLTAGRWADTSAELGTVKTSWVKGRMLIETPRGGGRSTYVEKSGEGVFAPRYMRAEIVPLKSVPTGVSFPDLRAGYYQGYAGTLMHISFERTLGKVTKTVEAVCISGGKEAVYPIYLRARGPNENPQYFFSREGSFLITVLKSQNAKITPVVLREKNRLVRGCRIERGDKLVKGKSGNLVEDVIYREGT
ncbi:MAG: hypothetical protein V1676_07540 [Candidatus Diapherotrites archaeon]